VIVLVVTQLGVGDAVERISKSIKLDPEQHEKDKNRLTEIEEKQQWLADDLKAMRPTDEREIIKQMEIVQAKLDADALKLKNLRQQNMNIQREIAQSAEAMEAEKKKREELESKIEEKLTTVAKKRAILDETPDRKVLPEKILRLPNPRPAPEGVQPISLICDNNRIYPLAFNPIQKAARVRAEQVVSKMKIDPAAGIDPEQFVQNFSRKPFRNDFFEIEMRAGRDGNPKLALTPKENAGARIKDIENRSSKFQKDLRSLDPTKFYIRFYVSADSFDAYLTARAVAESNNLAVGWIPQPADWKFVGNMGGEIKLGPPKEPTPPKPGGAQPPKKKNNDID